MTRRTVAFVFPGQGSQRTGMLDSVPRVEGFDSLLAEAERNSGLPRAKRAAAVRMVTSAASSSGNTPVVICAPTPVTVASARAAIALASRSRVCISSSVCRAAARVAAASARVASP
jgi:malonyl CoA-acyl carrier protein transacylase